MKNRTLVFGVCAVLFATASAFASQSALAPETVYVRVFIGGSTTPTCLATSLQCDDSGTNPCVIRVWNDDTEQYETTNGRRLASSCQIIKHINSTARDVNPSQDITGVTPFVP